MMSKKQQKFQIRVDKYLKGHYNGLCLERHNRTIYSVKEGKMDECTGTEGADGPER
jgi:hypothetical protein